LRYFDNTLLSRPFTPGQDIILNFFQITEKPVTTVVGIAGAIHPIKVDPAVLTRDMTVMTVLTVILFIFSYVFRGPGRINRVEGAVLLSCYLGYTAYLVMSVFGPKI